MGPLTGRFAADFPRWSPAQMFQIASDIERYPEFISWCRRVVVLTRNGTERVVDNHFGAGPADLHFITRAVAEPPSRLDIAAMDGPFRKFRLIWHFAENPQGGCAVTAEYELEFRSPMLQALARLSLREVERRLIARFAERAEMLYGASPQG